MDIEQTDFSVIGSMSLYLLTAVSDAARSWARRNLDCEVPISGSVPVEHRFVGEICRAILRDGLTVEFDGQAYFENDDGELVAIS